MIRLWLLGTAVAVGLAAVYAEGAETSTRHPVTRAQLRTMADGALAVGFYGSWAARFSGSPPLRATVSGALVALVGAGLILRKSLVHRGTRRGPPRLLRRSSPRSQPDVAGRRAAGSAPRWAEGSSGPGDHGCAAARHRRAMDHDHARDGLPGRPAGSARR